MGAIEDAVRADLDRWGLAGTGLAASALDLARRLDRPKVAPTPASMLHSQLRATLLDLRKLAPTEKTNDKVDEVNKRREQRRREAGLA